MSNDGVISALPSLSAHTYLRLSVRTLAGKEAGLFDAEGQPYSRLQQEGGHFIAKGRQLA